jgi:hypothetical protein
MMYRTLCTNNDWLPKEGGGIKLWCEDHKRRLLWLRGELAALSAQSIKNLNEIVKGISGFIKY